MWRIEDGNTKMPRNVEIRFSTGQRYIPGKMNSHIVFSESYYVTLSYNEGKIVAA